jgi:molybdate transport repressor ModE-like protein
MRRVLATPGWSLAGGRGARLPIDDRLLPLVAAIGERGSLAAAARELDMPYRTDWALLEAAERALGTPLASLARGRGAMLTPLAKRWLEAHAHAAEILASNVAPIEAGPVRETRAPRQQSPLRVAASHDIALAQLRDRWRVAHGVALSFHGSVESLAAYAAGNADVAGFHYVETGDGADPLLAMLRPQRDALIRFIIRSQGLILPRGNPRRVRALADIADKRLSIVNRQPASGTRLLFDRLLAAAGIAPSALPGYANEEFTHAAVAATVAAGKADAGFGIEAAAAQFGLVFVPLVEERYRFACRRRSLEKPGIVAFRKLIGSAATRAVVEPLPGYRLDRPGTPVAPD